MLNISSRLVLSGLSGGSGKTCITLGLIRALVRRGLIVQACKKGPDYIDTAWLAGAAKTSACNLDPYFLSDMKLLALVQDCMRTKHPDALIIEGNRGLYDGKDVAGTCSTAQLARLLKSPVIVVLPCTKMTRTLAAVVHGLATFEECALSGVVLNYVGSERHGRLVQMSIEQYTDVPVLGIVPRLHDNLIPECHTGLVAPHDMNADAIFENLADLVEKYLDMPHILDIIKNVPLLDEDTDAFWPDALIIDKAPVIGVVRDKVLWFYYEENLEALRRAGAKIVVLDIFDPLPWPKLDGLYLGGGFPESRAAELADAPHLATIRTLSDEGLPIYAECGGFLVLCHSIAVEEYDYPMAGVFPLRVELCAKPQGLGYVDVTVQRDTPFYQKGTTFRAHEFHYTRCRPLDEFDEWNELDELNEDAFVFKLTNGAGMEYKNHISRGLDGLIRHNTFGAYTYVYAPAVLEWAPSFVAACQRNKIRDGK